MKKIMTIYAALIMTANVFAQSPNKMSYQAVIRNASNALVANQAVGMRISILQGTASGTAVYVETQTPTTNANGLASIEIGGGSVNTGTFAAINWANGPYFIKTETDPVGSTNYSIIGTSQLLSVPYALYAKKAEIDNVQDGDTTYWKVNGTKIYYNNGKVGIGITNLNNLSAYLTINGDVGINSDSCHAHFFNKNYVLGSPSLKFYSTTNTNGGAYGINASRAGLAGNGKLLLNQYGGNVGIGNIDPQRTLHVNAVMRLEPIATAPTSPAKGDMYFDSTLNKLRVYDGAAWQNCW